jgi:hypothetical protein
MHYILPAELLKKKDKEAGEGPSSGPEQKKLDAPVQTESEEEEEAQLLVQKERAAHRKLPDNAMLSGAQVNHILGIVFGTEPLQKKQRTGVSPHKPLNPQPLASVTPRTHATTKATPIIDIQDDPEPETFLSTPIVEQPPPPLQLPNLLTATPHQTTTSELMQFDHPETEGRQTPQTTSEFPKPSSEISNPDPKAPEQSTILDVLNPSTQERQHESSTQDEAARSTKEPEADRDQKSPHHLRVRRPKKP